MDIQELHEYQDSDQELIPDIIPVDEKLSIRVKSSVILGLLKKAASITPTKVAVLGTDLTKLNAVAPSGSTVGEITALTVTDSKVLKQVTDRVTVREEGETYLPTKKVYDILRMVPDGYVELTVTGDTITIKSGRAVWRVQVPTYTPNRPVPDFEDLEYVSVDRLNFLQALQDVYPAMAKTNSRPSLAQVEFYKGEFVACDAARLHKSGGLDVPDSLHFTIPSAGVPEVIKTLSDSESDTLLVASTPLFTVFRVDGEDFIVNRLITKYPDVSKVFLGSAIQNLDSLSFNTKEMVNVVERVKVNTDPDASVIYLRLLKDKKNKWYAAVRGKDRVGNASQELIEVQWSGSKRNVDLSLNPKYFLDMLQGVKTDVSILKVGADTKTSKKPLLLESDNYTVVLQQTSLNWK